MAPAIFLGGNLMAKGKAEIVFIDEDTLTPEELKEIDHEPPEE